MERRIRAGNVAIEVRDGKGEEIVGHAAVYYDGSPGTEFVLLDWPGERVVERIMPGAFDRALREKDDARGLFNHDPSLLLGRRSAGTMTLETDSKGLRYRIQLAKTQVAQDVREHVRRGDLAGSSFAFIVKPGGQEWKTENASEVRMIKEVAELFDVGPVTYPAYEGTTTGLRAGARAAENENTRELLEALTAWRGERSRARGRAAAARARVVELDLLRPHRV